MSCNLTRTFIYVSPEVPLLKGSFYPALGMPRFDPTPSLVAVQLPFMCFPSVFVEPVSCTHSLLWKRLPVHCVGRATFLRSPSSFQEQSLKCQVKLHTQGTLELSKAGQKVMSQAWSRNKTGGGGHGVHG